MAKLNINSIAKFAGEIKESFLNGSASKSVSPLITNSSDIAFGVGDAFASWFKANSKMQQYAAYLDIPEVNIPVNFQVNALSNANIWIEDIKSGEIIHDHPLMLLLKNPNPLTGGVEFLKQAHLNYRIFGNSYVYTPLIKGFDRVTAQNVQSMWVLPAQLIKPIPSGKILGQTHISDIVKNYNLRLYGRSLEINTTEILQHSDGLDYKTLEGTSIIELVGKPIGILYNIYEADNVLISKHGSIGVFTHDQSDGGGEFLPLDPDEREKLQEAFSDYGLNATQHQYIITGMGIKYQSTIANIKDMQLDERQEKHRNRVLDAYGTNKDLFSSIKGSTFTNRDVAEKQLYTNTIIPDMRAWLSEFGRHFNLIDEGLQLNFNFQDVPVLQADKKEKNEALKIQNEALEKEWLNGLITRNDWLTALGKDIVNKAEFNKYIFELTVEDIEKIKILNALHPLAPAR